MMPTIEEYIKAAKVPRHLVPWQAWPYNAFVVPEKRPALLHPDKDFVVMCAANETGIMRINDDGFGGDVIMDDSRHEVLQHMPAILAARGRVLKTGLGMGCFVRAILLKDEVDHVDVVEIDEKIIKHFGAQFSDNPRVTVHHADALQWEPPEGAKYDLVWHDVWCEGNVGLSDLHTKLLRRFAKLAPKHGAWAYPRVVKKTLRRRGMKRLIG